MMWNDKCRKKADAYFYFTNIDRDDSLKPYIILLWQYNDSVEQI